LDLSEKEHVRMRGRAIAKQKFEVPAVKSGDLVEWAVPTKVSRQGIWQAVEMKAAVAE
jgi:hypothetical protein